MNAETLNIFIGYDPAEPLSYHVLAHSILTRASMPVSITPLARPTLYMHKRVRGPKDSTDFSITRFLVPYLSSYMGLSVYMDCDMLCLGDVRDLLYYEGGPHVIPQSSVYVAPHDYIPKGATKFLGHSQLAYSRKNWSSVMMFKNQRCQMLTPEYVDAAPGLDLHQLRWARNAEIGWLPLEWNWLVGEYIPNPNAKLLHYTQGGPWFEEYRDCDHADLWLAELDKMLGNAWIKRSR